RTSGEGYSSVALAEAPVARDIEHSAGDECSTAVGVGRRRQSQRARANLGQRSTAAVVLDRTADRRAGIEAADRQIGSVTREVEESIALQGAHGCLARGQPRKIHE